MNPRYPQQQERVSGQDRLLSQLAALKQGGSGLQQQQLAQQGQHEQISAALQLLGLQQQGDNEKSRQAFEQQQLSQSGNQFQQSLAQQGQHLNDLSGQFWSGTLPREYAAQEQTAKDAEATRALTAQHMANQSGEFWSGTYPLDQQRLVQQKASSDAAQNLEQQRVTNEQDYHKQALAMSGFSDVARMPGVNAHLAMQLLGAANPQLGNVVNQFDQQARQEAINRTAPMLKLIQDPAARELQGRTLLGQWPGAYEESLALAYPQQGPGTPTLPPPGQPQLPPAFQAMLPGLQAQQAAANAPIAAVGAQLAKQQADQKAMDYINQTFPSKAIPSTTQQWQSQDATGQLHPFFGR